MMPNWLGDVVLALSVVSRMKARGADAPVLLVPEHFADLARLLAAFPTIAVGRRGRAQRRRALDEVRGRRFDTVYLLPYSFSSALFAFRAGIPCRRGIAKDGRGILLTERLQARVRDYSKHLTLEQSLILRTDYVPPETWQGVRIAGSEKYRGAVVMCAGAQYGPAKRWEGFDELAGLLHSSRIVLLGKSGEVDGQLVSALARRGNVEDLTGKTTLCEAASIIAAASVVVSNDSGLMHVAGYVGTPVVGIFGSTSPSWTRPLGSNVRIAYTGEPCSPCFERTCRYGHCNCLKGISAQQVAALVRGVVE